MEFVDGRTLRKWRSDAERSWSDVLRHYEQAARGLAAAHAAGLVHRDFKPDNVLVDDAGRVRVVDFGLARLGSVALPSELPINSDQLTTALTLQGACIGTPAYMAPEQIAGKTVDARTDQFAFCVALWEALSRERPFRGKTVREVFASVERGEIGGSQRGAMPKWIEATLRRGLAVDPEQRWPSMDALLSALSRGRARAQRRMWWVGGAIVLAAAGAIVGARELAELQRERACASEGEAIAQMWPGRADAVAQGVRATGFDYAEATIENIGPRVDAWAAEWAAAREGVCLAATVEHTMADEIVARARACFDRDRIEVETHLDELAASSARATEGAILTMSSLPRPEDCTDLARLESERWPDDDRWPQVDALQQRLASADALAIAGGHARAVDEAKAVLAEAIEVDWIPLVATAHYSLGLALEKAGDYGEAGEHYEAAYFDAGRSGHDETAARAAMSLLLVKGRRGEIDAGLEWSRHAHMLLERLEWIGTPQEILYLSNIAGLHAERGDHDKAAEVLERALAVVEVELGPDHPRMGVTLTQLGELNRRRGEFEDAEAFARRALHIIEKQGGPTHQMLAFALGNLGATLASMGRYDEAEQTLRRVLELDVQLLASNYDSVLAARATLARLASRRGDHRAALAELEGVLDATSKRNGPESLQLAAVLNNLASEHGVAGHLDRELEMHERALAIREKHLGPEHADVSQSLVGIGAACAGLGRYEDAERALGRALAIAEKHFGPADPRMVPPVIVLGDVARLSGDLPRAKERYERAASLIDPSSPTSGEVHFSLAHVLWELGDERVRALELAGQAEVVFRNAGMPQADDVAAWIEARSESSG